MNSELERRLNYEFKKPEILKIALTHKSFHEGSKKNLPDNEKLEFLGDSVINLVVTEYLFKRFKNSREGDLSKLKAHLVSSNFLFRVARTIHLGDFILLGKGEEKNGGRENRRIIASLFEALAGAIFVESGFRIARAVLLPYFRNAIEELIHHHQEIKVNDYKSELQELVQRDQEALPEYRVVQTAGKPPNVQFTCAVFLDGEEVARGIGDNKRQAEQEAALRALQKIGDKFQYEKLSEVFFLKND